MSILKKYNIEEITDVTEGKYQIEGIRELDENSPYTNFLDYMLRVVPLLRPLFKLNLLIAVIFFAVIIFFGCGSAQDYTQSKTTEKSSETSTSSSTTTASGQQLNGDAFPVNGYVSPINISVDGKSYKDSEDFYTQEMRRLQAETKAKYAGYKLSFNASIGLRNFKTGMYVYLVSTGDVGVASESYVDATGKFSFLLDGKTDRNVMYTLRATKRISMELTKDKETIQWCYNMYAEKEISLDGKSAVLRQFATVVTEYQCSDPANGIQLPDRQYSVEEEENMARDKAEAERTAAINAAATANTTPVASSTSTSSAAASTSTVVTPSSTTAASTTSSSAASLTK